MRARESPVALARHPLHLVVGLGIWFAWFCLTYGGVAVACAVAPPQPSLGAVNWVNAAVLGFALVTTAGLGWAAWTTARMALRLPRADDSFGEAPGKDAIDTKAAGGEPAGRQAVGEVAAGRDAAGAVAAGRDAPVRARFFTTVAAWLYAIAALSTVVIALPAVLLPPCV